MGKDILQFLLGLGGTFIVLIAVEVVFMFAGRGWKRGRGELPSYIFANNPTMTVNNPKIEREKS